VSSDRTGRLPFCFADPLNAAGSERVTYTVTVNGNGAIWLGTVTAEQQTAALVGARLAGGAVKNTGPL
jgi:hypothetical protein